MKTVERTPAPFARGEMVNVTEPGIKPWGGTVTSCKFSQVSGWWVDIWREDGGTYSVNAALVSLRPKAEGVVSKQT